MHPFQKNGLCFGSSREESFSRWWFHFFFSPPFWGRFPVWLIFFKWVGSTTNQFWYFPNHPFSNAKRNLLGPPPGGCESWSRQFGWAPQAEQLVLDLGILASNLRKTSSKSHGIYSEDHLRIIRFLQPQTVGSKNNYFHILFAFRFTLIFSFSSPWLAKVLIIWGGWMVNSNGTSWHLRKHRFYYPP